MPTEIISPETHLVYAASIMAFAPAVPTGKRPSHRVVMFAATCFDTAVEKAKATALEYYPSIDLWTDHAISLIEMISCKTLAFDVSDKEADPEWPDEVEANERIF